MFFLSSFSSPSDRLVQNCVTLITVLHKHEHFTLSSVGTHPFLKLYDVLDSITAASFAMPYSSLVCAKALNKEFETYKLLKTTDLEIH